MAANALNDLRNNWELIFAPAIENASAAMSAWTNGDVSLALDEVREVEVEEVAAALDLTDELSTMVLLGIGGAMGGQLILSFDRDNACRLIASLLNREVDRDESWNELEISALQETGNILSSAYLNAITALTGRRLWPSPPSVTEDYAMSVVGQAVMTQALTEDRVLLCRTRFSRLGQRVEWNLIFVPSPELLQLLREMAATL
ncbi:MAG: chemotaxis protein CheC [Planctomycetaceae bacterium]|nr:chemotaxis protein CheC [Planctomycetaceae bacterium]